MMENMEHRTSFRTEVIPVTAAAPARRDRDVVRPLGQAGRSALALLLGLPL
jgi:hypothetical protein